MLTRWYLKSVKNETISHEAYSFTLRVFVSILHFYSCKIYDEVQKHFAMALNCEPGFIAKVFDAMKLNQYLPVCILVRGLSIPCF